MIHCDPHDTPFSEGESMETKEILESQLTESMENELTDEQLQQLAEGSCSWGANCHG